jgi:hypothetical protein
MLILKSPYASVDVSVGCWDPESGSASTCPCALSWHQSLVQNTADQLQWNPAYQCNICSCQRMCGRFSQLERLFFTKLNSASEN